MRKSVTVVCLLLLATVLVRTPYVHAGTPAITEDPSTDKEKVIDERYRVEEGGMLEIAVGDSDVEIVTGPSDEVHVEVWIAGRDLDTARAYFEHQQFSVDHKSEGTRRHTVHIRTDAKTSFRTNWRNWRDHPQILTRVAVPERFHANLRTSDGDVSVERLQGKVRIRTSDGDVRVGSLTGPTLSLDTSDGDIQADALEGDTITLETSDGDIVLGTAIADEITLRTSDGDVRARQLTGNVEAKTSDGDIHFEAIESDIFSTRTSDGDITIDELLASQSSVRSSDGSIYLRRITGALDVSGSGDIRLDLADPAAVSASTSDGDIEISAPGSMSADLYLRGDDVRVGRAFNFRGEVRDDRAEGNLNGGGPMIEAKTSDGDVTLRAN